MNLYDLRKTLASKSLLIITLAIILISSISVSSSILAAQHPQPSNLVDSSALFYYNKYGFNLFIFAYNLFGLPLSDIQCRFVLSVNGYSGSNYNTTGFTNSSGLVTLSIPFPAGNLTQKQQLLVAYTWAPPIGSSYAGEQQYGPVDLPVNLTEGEIYGLGFVSAIVGRSNFSEHRVQIFYAGPEGTAPKNYSIYYQGNDPDFAPNSNVTSAEFFDQLAQSNNQTSIKTRASNMIFLGTLNNFQESYVLKNITSLSGFSEISFAVFSSMVRFSRCRARFRFPVSLPKPLLKLLLQL